MPFAPSFAPSFALLFADSRDATAAEVFAWLTQQGTHAVRVASTDPIRDLDLTLSSQHQDAVVTLDSRKEIRMSDVRACWHRGGGWRVPLPELAPEGLRILLQAEAEALTDALFELCATRPALGLPRRHTPAPSLTQLIRARASGLAIPTTLVTTRKASLSAFLHTHPKAVTKRIEFPPLFQDGQQVWTAGGTRLLTPADVASLDAHFFPALVQAYVEKAYELRVFVLDASLYAMAILPTRGHPPQVDVRQADPQAAVRFVPYSLPAASTQALLTLMKALQLNSGSIDLIVTPDDQLVFLEVNPIGQLDGVSKACHYALEKALAEWLGGNTP